MLDEMHRIAVRFRRVHGFMLSRTEVSSEMTLQNLWSGLQNWMIAFWTMANNQLAMCRRFTGARTRVFITSCLMLLIFSREFPLTTQLPLEENTHQFPPSDVIYNTHASGLYDDDDAALPEDNTIVYPRIHPSLRRSRRSSQWDTRNSGKPAGDQEDVIVTIRHNDSSTFFLELKPYEKLLGKDFSIILRSDNNTLEYVDSSQWKNKKCLYQGKILSHGGGKAAISMCHGDGKMYGLLVTSDGSSYRLRPISTKTRRRRDLQDDGLIAHTLYSESDIEDKGEFCGNHAGKSVTPPITSGNYVTENRSKRKREAQDFDKKIIETAIFLDPDLYAEFERKHGNKAVSELVKMVLANMFQVHILYHHESMKMNIEIVIIRLEIIKSRSAGPKTGNGDIDKYLDNFCAWQRRKNSQLLTNKWDHALMLTGLDLYKMVGSRKNNRVLGLAWVNGMCRPQYSCTLNEGKSFEAAFVIAHELGHSLGIQHDGRGNNCDPDRFIMSDKTGGGKIDWSSCSNKYLEDFFRRGNGKCLSNDATPSPDLELDTDGKLPGELYPPDVQCKLSLGSDYKPYVTSDYPFNDICHELWCLSGAWARPAHPALEGTKCAEGKWCIHGRCVTDTSQPIRRDIGSSEETTKSKGRQSIVEDVKGFFRNIYSKLREMAGIFSGR